MFKLTRQRAANCGVDCGEDGLYLGSAALIERDEHRSYRIRTAAEIEALLAAAYETPPDLAGCLAGLDNVSADLLAGHVALAQIRALQLRLFEIPEDRLDLLARADRLLKANFDPAEPRDRQGRWTDDNERQLKANGAFAHIGETIDGLKARFPVTRAGVMAAAHREGAPATKDYLTRIKANRLTSKGLPLKPPDRPIETRLRTFSETSYE
jgi:hypothetical protein